MNLATADSTVDYVNTGAWSKKAIGEAKRYCKVSTSPPTKPHRTTPPCRRRRALKLTPGRRVLPLHAERDHRRRGVRLRPRDRQRAAGRGYVLAPSCRGRSTCRKFGLIYAGAQKNIGPSGICVVIVRDDLIGKARPGTPVGVGLQGHGRRRLDAQHAADLRLVLRGPRVQVAQEAGRPAGHGSSATAPRPRSSTASSTTRGFYKSPVAKNCRSWMNVPFTLAKPDLDKTFCAEAAKAGLMNLEGHRSVGGMRASIYNAMPHRGRRRAGRSS